MNIIRLLVLKKNDGEINFFLIELTII